MLPLPRAPVAIARLGKGTKRMHEMRERKPDWLTVGVVLLVALGLGNLVEGVEADPSLAAKGEKIYADKKCPACHTIRGKEEKIGGDLSNEGAKRDAQWLRTFFNNPKAMVPKAKMMPSFKGTEEELNALVAYLASLK
jgi:cytochrome c2